MWYIRWLWARRRSLLLLASYYMSVLVGRSILLDNSVRCLVRLWLLDCDGGHFDAGFRIGSGTLRRSGIT